jgi:hypothetical protein
MLLGKYFKEYGYLESGYIKVLKYKPAKYIKLDGKKSRSSL